MGSTHRIGCNYKCSNGEEINIYGIKQVTLVQDILAIPTTFIISDVNCAILGLDTITKNKLQRVGGYSGYLARDYAEVKLDYRQPLPVFY
eukprot:2799001-Amphidinium_carterae.1